MSSGGSLGTTAGGLALAAIVLVNDVDKMQ
jgi:hypothetical protein